jgi:hypothetical protein
MSTRLEHIQTIPGSTNWRNHYRQPPAIATHLPAVKHEPDPLLTRIRSAQSPTIDYTAEMDALISSLAADRVKIYTITRLFNEAFDTQATMRMIGERKRQLGHISVKVNEWGDEAVEMLYQYYGIYLQDTIASIINKKLGTAYTIGAIDQKAKRLGIKGRTAQGDRLLADAARELNVHVGTLKNYMRHHGMKPYGHGHFRYVKHEDFARCRVGFAAPPEPCVTVARAAELLCYSKNQVRRMMRNNTLATFAHGNYLLVSYASISAAIAARNMAARERTAPPRALESHLIHLWQAARNLNLSTEVLLGYARRKNLWLGKDGARYVMKIADIETVRLAYPSIDTPTIGVDDLAVRLSKRPSTVYRMLNGGVITSLRKGRSYLVTERALMQYVIDTAVDKLGTAATRAALSSVFCLPGNWGFLRDAA